MASNPVLAYLDAKKNSFIREAGVAFFKFFAPTGRQGHNDAADAFRHAFISGKIANQYGDGIARIFGNLIEAENVNFVPFEPAFGIPSGPAKFYMDQWNNAVGRGLAKIAINDEHLAQLTAAAVRTGTLITSLNDIRISPQEAEGTGIPTFGLSEEKNANAALKEFESTVHTTKDGRVFIGDAEDDFISEIKPLGTPNPRCFAAGTSIDMADGSRKPIEDIRIGDKVLAYDPDADSGRGALRPSKVTQTHLTPNSIVLDFWGTRVTPGHVFLCGDGPYEGQHRMLIDIIRDDGALVRADGTVVRAATNCEVGSAGDQMVVVGYFHGSEDYIARNGEIRVGELRAATFISANNGRDFSVLDMIASGGFTLLPNGLVVKDGEEPHPFYYFAPLPRPEDYILKRSGVTLEELYSEDTSLETDPNAIPAPAFTEAQPVAASAGQLQMAGNRRDRRRQKAQQRRRGGETFH